MGCVRLERGKTHIGAATMVCRVESIFLLHCNGLKGGYSRE